MSRLGHYRRDEPGFEAIKVGNMHGTLSLTT